MKNRVVLYIAPGSTSFVQGDIEWLSADYEVKIITDTWSAGLKWFIDLGIHILKVLLYLPKADAVIISFTGYWSLFPSMLSKVFKIPCFIILNGTDSASIPSINYGSLRLKRMRWFTRESLKRCTTVLPVSSSLLKCTNSFNPEISSVEQDQGVQVFFPELKFTYEVIPNGIDVDFWNFEEGAKVEKSFIAVFSKNQFYLKGGDLICETAIKFPNYVFYIAGTSADQVPSSVSIPANVKFLGRLGREELREYYRKCEYVLQLSSFEGFGCALCEAMSCGCFPIVSNVNNLPTIAGESSIVLTAKDRVLFEQVLRSIEGQDAKTKEDWKKSRAHVTENYSLEHRRRPFLKLIQMHIWD